MAKILLLAPPYLDLYGELRTAAGRYFPLGLGYVASYLRKYGHDVSMYEPEAQQLSLQELRAIITRTKPDVVGLTCATPNFMRAVDLARECKECSDAKVVLGGVHASAIPEFIMATYSEFFDCLVVGEGEETILEVVETLARGGTLAGIPGIVCMEDGKPIRTETRAYITELDKIPHPARDLIPQHLFRPNKHNGRYKKSFTILTTRGCPYGCTFCAARLVSGRQYRTHSADYVLDEMQMLKRDFGAQQLVITDDTFTIKRKRLVEICEGMIKKRLNLSWFCFSQPNTVDRETLSLMKRAGCYNIGFGVESADIGILRRMGKNIKPEHSLDVVRTANSLGIKTQAFYILGSPGETWEQMIKTIEFAEKVNSTLAFFNMLVPYPGTPDFDYFFSDTPLEEIDWEDFVAIGEKCVLAGRSEVSAKDIENLIASANLRYYMNPKRVLGLLYQIRTPHELSNYLTGGVSLLKQILKWNRGKRTGRRPRGTANLKHQP